MHLSMVNTSQCISFQFLPNLREINPWSRQPIRVHQFACERESKICVAPSGAGADCLSSAREYLCPFVSIRG